MSTSSGAMTNGRHRRGRDAGAVEVTVTDLLTRTLIRCSLCGELVDEDDRAAGLDPPVCLTCHDRPAGGA
jgi:hypothetical protein